MASTPATTAAPASPSADRPSLGEFVHLHLHTEYSLLDGGNQIDKLVARVAELGMKAVAITDHGNIFGAVSLYSACKEKGIKPILGVEAYVTPPGKPRTDRTYSGGGEGGYHLVLLAQNDAGWRNLMYLCSEAFLTGFYYKPRIDREILAKHAEGLIAINGHLGSEIGEHLLAFHRSKDQKYWDAAVESAQWHAAALPGRFYVELQHHVPEQNAINPLLIKLAKSLNLPLVCDNDAHFLRAQDHDAHDTLICISTGKGKNDPDRMRYPGELYVKSAAEMKELMARYGEDGATALANTVKIAESCNVTLPIGANNAPMVRVRRKGLGDSGSGTKKGEWEGLPAWDDPAFGGDLTAWYNAYCAEFEVVPFAIPDGADEEEKKSLLATAKAECDQALRLLAEGGFRWRYARGVEEVLGGPTVPVGSSEDGRDVALNIVPVAAPADLNALARCRGQRLLPRFFFGADPYPPDAYGLSERATIERRDLPHIELPNATYFVTWKTHGARPLDEAAMTETLAALLHFNGERCHTFAACVMNTHVHWLVRPLKGYSLSDLVTSVKEFTARAINKRLAKKGPIWQGEQFDHIVRDADRFTEALWYIADNPVEAGIVASFDRYPWTYIDASCARTDGDRRATQEQAPQDDYLFRLERELKILADKNISAYFLIVWDFVNWGRQQGIPANARGSGVGTMVGYVLGLSNACPVKYGLLFERFTDPDRSEFPDIDIDLCQDGRGSVINYVRTKYGHVAQIITFGTLGAKAALRDVGRVLGVPLGEVDRLCKLIPQQLNISLNESLEQEPEFKKAYDTSQQFKQLIDNAIALEGHTRHAGVHAAGVIVATRPLHEIVPLYKPSGSEANEIITQWDGPTCEKMGLLKMDFLGLRTLSIVERAKKLIREGLPEEEIWRAVGRAAEWEEWSKGQGVKGSAEDKKKKRAGAKDEATPAPLAHPLDLDRLTYADPKVFELFQRGETTGVFQFESGGMRRLLVEMKPDRLEDLIAANALFRPGPMDLIPDYNRRKHGTEPVPKVHAIVDQYTAETYGVMVYQEQVMQIVHGLGGIKLRDAYTLIKNISKKKHDKIEKERPKFVEGSQKQGLSKAAAEDLFELILKFAGYGFNKSHSTGYAIVAYQTAYLKTYFPNQYMAAFLTFESQASKVSEWIPYLEDCRRTRFLDPATGKQLKVGVEVRPPDVNLSGSEFAVVFADGEPRTAGAGHVRFGLKALKGAGDKAVEAVMVERAKHGPFTSLYDFTERLPGGILNKTMLEALIKSGAFDSVHGRPARAAMIGSIEGAMTAGQKAASDKASGQSALFGGPGPDAKAVPAAPAPLAKMEPWNEAETLASEKEVLGFYVSSHPLDRWKGWYSAFTSATTNTIKDLQQDARVVLAAMIQDVRAVIVKNGKSAGQKMGILTVEDAGGACDCVMFTDCYAKYGHLATKENVVFILGRIDLKRGDPQVLIDRLVPIDGLPLDGGKVRLFVDELKLNGAAANAMQRVADIIRGNPAPPAPGASFPVEIVIGTEDKVALLAVDPKILIALAPNFVRAIETELGPGMVKLSGGVSLDKVEKDKPKWSKRRGGDDDE